MMDNIRTHHVKEVQTLLQGAGMKLRYLPAYSPNLNPIENMRSKIKAILCKLKIRLLFLLFYACFFMVLLRLSRESVHRTAPVGFLPPVSPVNFLDCHRTCIHNRCTPSDRSFFLHAAPISEF
ncbi:MAG: hypothetical protein HFG01_09800 [Oscillibacter sp.]|jgi:hypothetical protein|nr:hypothetical protein [Oscillibacter sp.]